MIPSEEKKIRQTLKQKTWNEIKTNDSWAIFKVMSEFVEGFEKMSKIFAGLAKVEKEHHDNYQRTLESLDNANKSEFSESNGYLDNAPK